MYYALSYGWYYPEDTYPAFDIINITISGSMLGFGLLMLAVQTIFTVSDSFNICLELTMKCVVILGSITYIEILEHTDLILYGMENNKWTYFLLVISGEILLQILITDYHLWSNLSWSPKTSSRDRYTIDLKMVLKDSDLFTRFEDQLKQEFSLENLNFLVSCINYRRIAIRQGNFGIESSFSETEHETFHMLNWRETIADDNCDPNAIANFIWNEYCARGAPQEINLDKETRQRLSARMGKLSNVYNNAQLDLFSEAYHLIYDELENDPVLRFKKNLTISCGIQSCDNIDDYGMSLLRG